MHVDHVACAWDDLDAAADVYALSPPTTRGASGDAETGGRRLAWLDSDLLGTTVGVVERR